MKIVIETIPHGEQRYETAGDWFLDPDGTVRIRVSDLGRESFNNLLIVHELVEWMLCRARGIDAATVDAFDLAYIKQGRQGEPGDDFMAPYWHEHQFAEGFERLLGAELSVNWDEYDRCVEALFEE